MGLALVNAAATQHQPSVLNDVATVRLTAINHATRCLRALGITVLSSQLAGHLPHITVQYVPGKMTRLLNLMPNRHPRVDGDCTVVSGRFEDVVVVWVVPQ